LSNVLLAAAHALDSLSALLLNGIDRSRNTLDVTEGGESEYALLLRNEVLNVNLAGNGGNFREPVVGIAALEFKSLVLDDCKNL